MFTSDTNTNNRDTRTVYNKNTPVRKLRKSAIVCLILAAVCITIDNVYALFGHGVRSSAMSLMFLYPLVGGTLVYFLLGILRPGIAGTLRFRPFYNLYNSGLAILTVGSLLQGILDIAGTTSAYLLAYSILGWGCAALGFLFYAVNLFSLRENK